MLNTSSSFVVCYFWLRCLLSCFFVFLLNCLFRWQQSGGEDSLNGRLLLWNARVRISADWFKVVVITFCTATVGFVFSRQEIYMLYIKDYCCAFVRVYRNQFLALLGYLRSHSVARIFFGGSTRYSAYNIHVTSESQHAASPPKQMPAQATS